MTDEQHSLQTYVSDMLALEQHVRVPFETQAKDEDFSKYGNAGALVRDLLNLSQQHIDSLQSCLDTLGGHAASPTKSATAAFEGFVAGAIDKIRKTKVSKALRDDYTALALCTAGYTLLQSTAIALDNASVADVAQRHLRDYAQRVMQIGQALPQVVVAELKDIGLNVDISAMEPARRAAEQAWSGAGREARASESGTVDSASYAGTASRGSSYTAPVGGGNGGKPTL